MRRIAWLLVVVAITIGGRTAAQSRADFSGRWKGPIDLLTIKQDATTLTITNGSETRTYRLDGSDSRWTESAGKSQRTARARWVQSALVIETMTVSSIGSWTDMEIYSLDHGPLVSAPQSPSPQLSVVYVFTREAGPMMGTSVTTYTKN